jgi:hypothetical protein
MVTGRVLFDTLTVTVNVLYFLAHVTVLGAQIVYAVGRMIQGLILGRGQRVFSSPNHPDQLWGPPSFLFNGYRGSFPGGKAVRV